MSITSYKYGYCGSHTRKLHSIITARWPPNLYIFVLLFGSTDGAVELARSRNKVHAKKTAFREIFVARYIPILQYCSCGKHTLCTFHPGHHPALSCPIFTLYMTPKSEEENLARLDLQFKHMLV